VLREPGLEVLQVSANLAERFGVAPDVALGRPLADLIGSGAASSVQALLALEHPEEGNPLRIDIGTRAFDGIVHRYLGATILELEPAGAPPAGPTVQRLLQRALARSQASSSLQTLCGAVVPAVRALTGFDRVLMYRFDDEGHGEVIAEDLEAGMTSYLGLHYPASDIPKQARELYLRNWLRMIPDREYQPVPIVPPDRTDTGQPLDLSLSTLRSVSPIHLEYLKNMGVRASMSISIITHDRLGA
jgi:light-regulated signal transduction histidine kinase (bacteriophytochrome)